MLHPTINPPWVLTIRLRGSYSSKYAGTTGVWGDDIALLEGQCVRFHGSIDEVVYIPAIDDPEARQDASLFLMNSFLILNASIWPLKVLS